MVVFPLLSILQVDASYLWRHYISVVPNGHHLLGITAPDALSAIITPPDIFSQVLVCFPLLFLYEIGIIISRRVIAKDRERLEAEWSEDENNPESKP